MAPEDADVVAHVQRTGDVPGKIGEWVGTRGSRQWIEGFSLAPRDGIKPTDVEYQAVLGRGWLSPWIEGGKFCGSRGMALPLLGLKVRLKGAAAKTHECSYSASFVDGSAVGPVPAGETCEAESLAALEAFQMVIRRAEVREPRAARCAQAAARRTSRQPTASLPRDRPSPAIALSTDGPRDSRRQGARREIPVRPPELSRPVPAHRPAPRRAAKQHDVVFLTEPNANRIPACGRCRIPSRRRGRR